MHVAMYAKKIDFTVGSIITSISKSLFSCLSYLNFNKRTSSSCSYLPIRNTEKT